MWRKNAAGFWKYGSGIDRLSFFGGFHYNKKIEECG